MRRAFSILAATAVLAGLLATPSTGQTSVITSICGDGTLTWANAVNTNAIYRVEWASQPDGPWHAFTYQPLHTLDAHSATSFTASLPVHYRVVMETNQPPLAMAWIDGGDVVLGDTRGVGESWELPVHTNFISGFWMDAMEVTKSKWDEVYRWATNNGYAFDNVGAGKTTNDHPVQTVNWYDCVKWCNARSQIEGLTPCYYTNDPPSCLYTNGQINMSNNWVNWSANGYRLPTEAEWEKAACGGRQGRLFPWGGDTVQHALANYYSTDTNSYDTSPTPGFHPTYNDSVPPYTSPVGSFAPNGYGLYDMAGNVWEWCWDRRDTYSADYRTDPLGAAAFFLRVTRGGSWSRVAADMRCASRHFAHQIPMWGWDYGGIVPDEALNDVGFRCVRRR